MAPVLPTSTVTCADRRRPAGRIVNSVFVPTSPGHHPIAAPTGSRCGSCGGRLNLEAEGAVTPAQAAYLAATRTAPVQDVDPRM